ncbi:MAG: hypothetical protein IKS83_06145 [Victivallales bacterium]|nr:hypothetical protein [Victivallales bacterium]
MNAQEAVTHTVQCLGCDAACEVYVEMRNGQPVCLGGNNCPTGEQYACAQCNSTTTH